MTSGVDAIINERRPDGGTSDVATAEGSVHESQESGSTNDAGSNSQSGSTDGGGEPLVNPDILRHSDGSLPFQKKPENFDVKMDASKASDVMTSLSLLLSVV